MIIVPVFECGSPLAHVAAQLYFIYFYVADGVSRIWCNGQHYRLSRGSSGFDSPYPNDFFLTTS